MKYRLKFRVTEESGEKRKYSINLEDRDRFPLGRDSVGVTLPGAPDPAVLCILFVKDGCIWVEDRKCPGGITVNNRSGREFPLQQGDMLQIGTFSVEFLEAPVPPKAEPRETQFLDLQEFMKSGSGAAKSPAPANNPASGPSNATIPSQGGGRRNKKSRRQQQQQQQAAQPQPKQRSLSEQTSELQTPVNVAAASPVTTQPQKIDDTGVQAFSVPAEGGETGAGFVPEQQPVQQSAGMNTAPPDQTGQTNLTGFTSFNDAFNNGEPAENKIADAFPGRDFMPVSRPDSLAGGGAGAGGSTSSRRAHHPAESLPTSSSSSSSSGRRHPQNAARQQHSSTHTQPSYIPNVEVRSSGPGEQTLLTEKNREIIQTSMGLFILVCSSAAMGSLLARRLGEAMFGANGVQTAIIVYSTIAIALAFLLSWVFHLCHEYMRTPSQFPAFLRFSSWASLLMIPWAYSFSFQPSGIVFVTLLLTIVGMTAFLVRFKPDLPRFFAVSGITFVVLAAGSYPVIKETPIFLHGSQRMMATEDESPEAPGTAPGAAQRLPAGTAAPAAQSPAAPVQPQAPAVTTPAPVTPPVSQAAPQTQTPAAPMAVATAAPLDPSNRILDPLANDQFFTAVRSGNLDVVKDLITKGAIDANFTLYQGNTPLLVAASSGQLDIVKYLAAQRVNLNAQDPNGTTALMWAVYKGNKDMVSFLIQKGANLNTRRDDGDTAYDLAKTWKKTEVAKIFEAIYAQRRIASQGSSHSKSKSHSKSSKHSHSSDDDN